MDLWLLTGRYAGGYGLIFAYISKEFLVKYPL